MKYKQWIVRDPKVCDGWPHIKGTKVLLKTVLGHLALGDPIENIVEAYPGLTAEGVRAVIAFAASMVDSELEGQKQFYIEATKLCAKILEKDPKNSEVRKKFKEFEEKMKDMS